MIKRELYLAQLRTFIDKPLIKVLTGIRRCGKSALLSMLKDELTARGIKNDNIIYINFESMQYAEIDTAQALYNEVQEKITAGGSKFYLLLDEIQEVHSWEKAINSFLVDFDVDIYITGSNSRLLSSELATYIAGRYIEINITPLSFSEFLLFREKMQDEKIGDIRSSFVDFLRLGGFPAIHIMQCNQETAYQVVKDIYASAILRDTVERHNIRNIDLLERIVKFVFDNVGNMFSAKKVADYFKRQHRKVDLNTVYNYLNALESAFIIQRVQRYDVRGKSILQTNEKYYIGDQSLKYAVMGYRDRDISGILENIVCLELKRRGYQVYVGKLDDKEIDFIAKRQAEKVYVQVSWKLSSEETIKREFQPLMAIRDNYPKYVVTMEEFWEDNIEGVKHMNIAEFLLLKDL